MPQPHPPSLFRNLLFILIFLCFGNNSAFALHTCSDPSQPEDTLPSLSSTENEAVHFLDGIRHEDTSLFWPHVRARLFLENLRLNINHPVLLYQGSNTNFCGYAALSYLPLRDDPLGFVRFMVSIFRTGKATWNGISFEPSAAVKQAAGTLRFKGELDIRPADQMWFLILADHFKGYLNFFTPNYHPGSENTFWAAVNFGKFNRILKKLLRYKVEAAGSDLIGPWIGDLYGYLSQSVLTGTTFLYVNNTYLHKKNHTTIKAGFPTHFIVLTNIWKDGDIIKIIYWDYGGMSLREVTPAFLKKITFGISHCTKMPKEPDQ
ncbi:hypothetical protein ACX0G9_00305 [Flavitalea flava]